MKKKLNPYVTLEAVDAYEPKRPETQTCCPVVNAFIDALWVVKPANGEKIARYMGVDYRDLNGALKLATGKGFIELRERWVMRQYKRLRAAQPEMPSDQLALELGLSDRSSLWRLAKRMGEEYVPTQRRVPTYEEYLKRFKSARRQ